MTSLESFDDGSQVALVDLVNRLMDRGVAISGEVVISVADVDLVYLNLSLLLASVETVLRNPDSGRRAGAPSEESP